MRLNFQWKPLPHLWFVFSIPSKRFQRVYVYSGRWFVAARNNWGGQLKGWFYAAIFWKNGPKFVYQAHPEQ